MKRLISLCAVSLAAVSAGCYQVTLADDMDFEFNFAPLIGASDAMHSPYVQGAGVRVYARSGDDRLSMDGWTVASSDPSVFRVDKVSTGNRVSAECTALAAGTAVVSVRNAKGEEVRGETVRVRMPDRVELLAHGPLLIHRPDSQAVMGEARVVKGGMGTFLVHWWAGEEQLSGNGVLSTDAPSGVVAKAETTSFFEQREWLQVTGTDVGAVSLGLFADGHLVGKFPVTVVPASSVTRMEMSGEDESRARQGDQLAVLAEAFADTEPVYGVEFAWTINGKEQKGLGDMFRYSLDTKEKGMLGARSGDLSAQAMIHAKEGYVTSSNRIGCSVGGNRAAGWSTIAMAALALAWTRRRRAIG